MHLYYVHVFHSLLRGSTTFSNAFVIHHLFPPYCLYYYLLMALLAVVSPAVAVKLIVCIIFIVTAAGFRFMAATAGPSGNLAALWVLPLMLNWPLAMGFFNYSLSLALGMWALGFWFRARNRNSTYAALYLVFIALMTLTHPVPLLFVLAVAGVDLVVQLIAAHKAPESAQPSHSLRFVSLIFALSCGSLLYVLQFVNRRSVAKNLSDSASRFASLHRIVKLSTLAVFSGRNWSTYAYRAGLYLLLLASLAAAGHAFYHRRKQFASSLSSPWLAITLLMMAFIAVCPSSINGSKFFSDRLLIVLWISALAAASVHSELPAPAQRAIAALAIAASLGLLWMADGRIRPIAKLIAATTSIPLREPVGSPGLLLGERISPEQTAELRELSYNPVFWELASNFRQADATVMNPPWLGLPILPIATQAFMLDHRYSQDILDAPGNIYASLLKASGKDRNSILGETKFLVAPTMEESKILGVLSKGWICTDTTAFVICNNPREISPAGASGP